jgi:hypothetical protein
MSLKMLARELSAQKQSFLAALVMTPGWRVVKEDLFADAVRQAQSDMVQIDPDAPDYERKVGAAQRYAKAISDVTQVLIRSVETHVSAVNDSD